MMDHIEKIADALFERVGDTKRFMVAIAGPPGAGKSTTADALVAALRKRGESAEVLPMDGFHMDNEVLSEKSLLPRKGCPESFDVRAFIDIVRAVRKADQEVLVPVFDRSREIAIASARIVAPTHRFIVVEGNYLLLDETPWTALEGLFDYSVLLAPPAAVLRQRLWDRWKGYDYSDEAAQAKLDLNDLPNGERVLNHRRHADLVIDAG